VHVIQRGAESLEGKPPLEVLRANLPFQVH